MQEAQGLVLGAIRKQRELDSQSTPNSVKASADSSVSPRKSSQREGLDLVERAWSGEQVDSEVVIRIQMTSPRGRQEFVSVGEGGNRDEARSGRKYLHEGEVERNGHSERRRQAGESVKKQITDAGRVVRGPFGSGVSGGQESREEDGCTLRSGARQDAEEGTNGSAQTESKNLEVKMEELGTVINAEEEGGPRSEAKSGRNFDTTCAAEVRRSLANGEESSEEVAVAVGSGQKTGGLEQVQQREGGGKPCSGLRERSTSMGLFTGAESLGAFGAARLESEGIQPANTGATDIERPSEIEKGESQEERWGGRSTGVTLDGNRRGDTQANLALETAAPCDDESEAGIGSVKDFFTPRRVGEKDAQVTSYQGRHGECESPGGVAKCELPSSTAAERASAPAWRGNGHVFTPHRGEAEENAYAAVGSRVTSPSEAVTSPALGSRLSQPTAFGWRASAGAKKASVNPENENSETVNPESVARPAERRLSLEVLPLDGERAGFAARAKAWRERLGTRANVSNVRGAERGCVGGESLDKGEKGRVASGDGTEEVKAGSIRGWCNQEGPPGAWRAANAEEEATETGTEEESEGQRLGRPGHVSDWLEAGSEKIRAWDGNLPGESTRRRREKGSAAQLGESEKGATMARERNRGADNRERTRIDLPGGSDRRGRSRNASRHRYPRSNSGSPSSGRRRNGRNSADSRIGRGKTKRGGKQSRSVSGESTGRSKPGPGERPESFSPRRSRFFKAVHEPGRVSREDWKAGTESSSGSSNGDNFERGRSDSGDHGSDSPEAERNGETQRNGGTGYRSGRKAREERRGRSVTRSEHRSRPRSKLSTSPRSRSYDRPSAQRTRKEALRGRPKTDRGAPEAEGQNGNGTLRDEETVCVVATEGSEAVSWADALFGAGENEEGICAPSKGLPLRLEDPAPSAMAVRSKENDLGVAAPLEPEERPVEGEGSAANDVGTEKAVSGPLLEPNLGAIECEQNGNESRNRLTDSVTAIKAKDSIAPERNLNGTEKAPAQPERGEGFGVANSGHVDAAVFLSAAGRLRAVAQQVRAWVEVGEQAKLQGITDTVMLR